MIAGLVEQFATLEDPRCPGKIEHRLVDILVIAVCAIVAEAETFEDIALYGRCKEAWLRGFLDLPGGIPSHDTFRRVFMLIDPDAFERCFLSWVREVFRSQDDDGPAGPKQIAVDGKLIRHSFDRRQGRSPLHLVSAYATGRGLVLAQHAVDHKGGEPAALPVVLEGLHLDGCLVSLDALSCRREVADHIVKRGADYLLTLKANQSKIHDEVRAWFAQHAFAPEADVRPCADAFDDTHGRLVRRRVFACPDAECFTRLRDWPGLSTVLATETIRGVTGTEAVTAEVRYYLSSSTVPPERLAQAIRRHWSIENGQHWVLDVTFGEDRSRVRERGAQPRAPTPHRPRSAARGRLAQGQREGKAQGCRLGRHLYGPTAQRVNRFMRLPWLSPGLTGLLLIPLLLLEQALAAGACQGITLEVEVLIVGGDASISDKHVATVPKLRLLGNRKADIFLRQKRGP